MNSRERVLIALSHKEPDRVPFDLGSSFATGITKNAYINLARYLGVEEEEIEFFDTVQQLVYPSERLLEKLSVDTRGVVPNIVRKNPEIEEKEDGKYFTDEWGIRWKMPKDGFYFDIVESPLSGNITEEDIEKFPWPDPTSPHLFDGVVEKAKKYYGNGYAVMLESFCSGIFEMSCRLRGYEQFYTDLAINPEIACKIMDKIVELKIKFYEEASKKIGKYIQFIREGDDIAGQKNLLISPKMYSEYIKPRHKQLFEAQKKYFPEPFFIFFHSDGAIYKIIPDFIEIGVEILNPVQITDEGITLEKLKKEFGKYLTFWGGGIDTQHTLPKGSKEEIREEVKKRIEILSQGGGFIFNTIHNIQDDVPPENIITMVETLMEFNKH